MGDSLLAGYSFSHYTNEIKLGAVHPSASEKISSSYQTFRINAVSGLKIKFPTKLVVYLRKVGLPTGHLIARIYNISGDRMCDAKPTGSPLASSEPVDIASLGAGFTGKTFVFGGTLEVEDGDEFCFAVEVTDGVFDSGPPYYAPFFVEGARGSTLVNGVYGWYSAGAWHHENE